jgi:hypothetical protein
MAVRSLPRERYVELYGPDFDAPTPAAPTSVNADAVLALLEPIPLLWDGVEYRVAPIGYLDGVRFSRLNAALKAAEKAPPQTEEEHEAFELKIVDVVERMHALLLPRPDENPFLAASPAEVGQLLGFFSMCLTLQTASGRSRMGRRSPSTT